jgi:hypothetical protein
MIVLIFGIVSTSVGLIVSRHRRANAHTAKGVPFTLVRNQRFFGKGDDKGSLRATITTYTRGDGSWKQFTTSYKDDGSVAGTNTIFGITARGVFGVDDDRQKLVFMSPKHHATHEIDEEQFRKGAQFVRDDVVLGFKVLVQRSEDGYHEFALCPALGGALLKEVSTTSEGRSVLEAVKIDLGEPSENDFGKIPDYPVDYTFYERRIKDAESQGNSALAQQMRQTLAEQKSNSQ